MALVGDNGAGKSTLVKCIAGTHSADSGQVLFEGSEVHIHSRRTPPGSGSRSSTRISRCATTSTSSRTCTSAARRKRFQILNEATMEQHTHETLKSLAVTTIKSIRQPVATLSGGQRQSVAVARAVMWNSKLVILDEPTAALGVAQTEQVLALVRRLGEQGLGVDPDLAQPPRRLRDRRPDHRAAARAQRRHLRPPDDDPAGRRRGDHRRSCRRRSSGIPSTAGGAA